MSARRSRIAIRPNLGRPPRGPAVEAQTKDKEEAAVEKEENRDLAPTSVTKGIEKEERDEPVVPKPSSLGSRRSRIKPQVRLKVRGNVPAPVTKTAEASTKTPELSGDTEVCAELGEQVQEAGNTKDESKANEVPKAAEDQPLPVTPLSTLASPNSMAGQVEPSENEEESTAASMGVEGSQSIETVKITPGRRSRFPKAKPNLAEAGRNRMRHSSMTETEDEAKRFLTPQKPVPQPTVRTHTLSESGPEPVSLAPHDLTDSVDGADKAKLGEKKMGLKKQRRTMGKLTTPIDRSKMTMRELIYNNPVNNPTKSTLEEMERKKNKKKSDGDGDSDISSVAGSVARSVAGSVRSEPVGAGSRRSSVVGSPIRPESVVDQAGATEEKTGDGGEGTEETPVPQVRIGEDGQIMLNEESLVIPTSTVTETVVDRDIIDETNKSYNATSFYGRRTKTKQWSLKETKKFYVALSMIGSDFSLMTKLFPHRTRTEIKRKFKKEEKIHQEIIDMALTDKKGFSLTLLDGPLSDSDDEEQENKKAKKKQGRVRKIKDEEENEGTDDSGSTKKKAAPRKREIKRKKRNYYDDSSSGDEVEESAVIDITGSGGEVGERAGPARGGEEEGEVEEVMSTIQKPTRSGRQPKRRQLYNLDAPPSQRAKPDQTEQLRERGEQITQHLIQRTGVPSHYTTTLGSPPHIISYPMPTLLGTSPPHGVPPHKPTLLGTSPPQGSPGPGQFIPLSNLGSIRTPVPTPSKPGLVFVAAKQHGDSEGQKDKNLIHVYLVSPPGTPNPPPCASPPLSPQPLLSPPAIGRLVGSPPPVGSSPGLMLPYTSIYSQVAQGAIPHRSQPMALQPTQAGRTALSSGSPLPHPFINLQRQSYTVTSGLKDNSIFLAGKSGKHIPVHPGTIPAPRTLSQTPSQSRPHSEGQSTSVTRMADGTITIQVQPPNRGESELGTECEEMEVT